MRRLRIHLWAPEFAGFGGGIGAYARALGRALASEHDVELFGKADRDGEWEGLRLRGAGAVPAGLRSAAFATVAGSGCVTRRPNLVVSCHPNFGPIARAATRMPEVPYVVVAHGIDVGPELAEARQRALRSAAAVWPVSRWTAARVQALGVPVERTSILPNTVDADRFTPGPRAAALLRRLAIAEDEKVILTVARLDAREAYKGCDRVLEALPFVREAVGSVRYVVVGEGDDRPRLQALAARLGLGTCVSFAGFVDDDDLADHYRLANVFAMPSQREGFGIVFLEAMAAGVPVVGGDADGTVDALDDGALGRLVNTADPRAIAGAIVGMLRREGPPMWFAPEELRRACLARFGIDRFRELANAALGAALGLAA